MTKCLFPVAGLGTRFLPVTKELAKEMLPLVNRPIISYGVEEALASGCSDIVMITKLSEIFHIYIVFSGIRYRYK